MRSREARRPWRRVVASGTALCVSLGILSSGCYAYAPTTLEAVPLGARMRALLSTESESRLKDTMGINARSLNATLVERGDSRLLLEVRTGTGLAELGSQPLYQRIEVSPSDVLRVDVRRVSALRTSLAAAAFAGAATAVVVLAFGGGNPGTPGGNNGGPPERVAAP